MGWPEELRGLPTLPSGRHTRTDGAVASSGLTARRADATALVNRTVASGTDVKPLRFGGHNRLANRQLLIKICNREPGRLPPQTVGRPSGVKTRDMEYPASAGPCDLHSAAPKWLERMFFSARRRISERVPGLMFSFSASTSSLILFGKSK